jgi:hypothetical protein
VAQPPIAVQDGVGAGVAHRAGHLNQILPKVSEGFSSGMARV